jgi:hypothetical protein
MTPAIIKKNVYCYVINEELKNDAFYVCSILIDKYIFLFHNNSFVEIRDFNDINHLFKIEISKIKFDKDLKKQLTSFIFSCNIDKLYSEYGSYLFSLELLKKLDISPLIIFKNELYDFFKNLKVNKEIKTSIYCDILKYNLNFDSHKEVDQYYYKILMKEKNINELLTKKKEFFILINTFHRFYFIIDKFKAYKNDTSIDYGCILKDNLKID